MAGLPEGPVAAARLIIDALEAEGLPYALGGALAYSFWGVPRATVDIDLNVFIPLARLDALLRALARAGCRCDEAEARARALAGDVVQAELAGMRVDLFLPTIPLSDAAAKRTVLRPLAGKATAILSAEDLILFKLLFNRPKDHEDVKRVVAIQGDLLDAAYIRAWLVDMVGEEDERVAFWERAWRTYRVS
jgi:hypothetical protein